jgi:hypothetical protein
MAIHFDSFQPAGKHYLSLGPLYKTQSESHSASLSYPSALSRRNPDSCSGASNMASSSTMNTLFFLVVVLLLSQALLAPVLCRQLLENRQSEKEASKSSAQTEVVRSSKSIFAGWIISCNLECGIDWIFLAASWPRTPSSCKDLEECEPNTDETISRVMMSSTLLALNV